MELIGICSICGTAGKMYTCTFCGKNVCARCLDSKRGICIQCAGARLSGSDINYR